MTQNNIKSTVKRISAPTQRAAAKKARQRRIEQPSEGPDPFRLYRGGRITSDLPGVFQFYRGGSLRDVHVAYEVYGKLNADKSNVILLFPGLSATAHAASSEASPETGWWELVIGPQKAIDTRKYCLICINNLGSCYGSTGPSTCDPHTGKPYGAHFPVLSVEDMAKAGFELMNHLGIKRLDTVMGVSMGAMIVLAYAALYPHSATRLVSISGTMAANPHAIATRALAREAIMTDPAWKNGHYALNRPPAQGLKLARKLSLLSYRSVAYFRERIAREVLPSDVVQIQDSGSEFLIQRYLEDVAGRTTRYFDANSFLYQSRAIDRFDLREHGPVHKLFERSALDRALVLGAKTDMLYEITEQRAIADALRRGGVKTKFVALSCDQGHDSFLSNQRAFALLIEKFLQRPAKDHFHASHNRVTNKSKKVRL